MNICLAGSVGAMSHLHQPHVYLDGMHVFPLVFQFLPSVQVWVNKTCQSLSVCVSPVIDLKPVKSDEYINNVEHILYRSLYEVIVSLGQSTRVIHVLVMHFNCAAEV